MSKSCSVKIVENSVVSTTEQERIVMTEKLSRRDERLQAELKFVRESGAKLGRYKILMNKFGKSNEYSDKSKEGEIYLYDSKEADVEGYYTIKFFEITTKGKYKLSKVTVKQNDNGNWAPKKGHSEFMFAEADIKGGVDSLSDEVLYSIGDYSMTKKVETIGASIELGSIKHIVKKYVKKMHKDISGDSNISGVVKKLLAEELEVIGEKAARVGKILVSFTVVSKNASANDYKKEIDELFNAVKDQEEFKDLVGMSDNPSVQKALVIDRLVENGELVARYNKELGKKSNSLKHRKVLVKKLLDQVIGVDSKNGTDIQGQMIYDAMDKVFAAYTVPPDREQLVMDFAASKKDGEKISQKASSKYVKQDRNVLETTEGAITFAEELDSMAKQKETDPEHKEHLLGWLRIITGKDYLPAELDLYFNKKAGYTAAAIKVNNTGKKGSQGIYLGIGNKSYTNQSALEKFVHEMTHGVEEFALNSRNPKIARAVSKLQVIHKAFLDKVTSKQLQKLGASKKEADELMEYMTGTNGFSEFLVHGATNKYIRKSLTTLVVRDAKANTTMFEKFVALFTSIVEMISDTVSGTRGESADKALLRLSVNLMGANNAAQSDMERGAVATVIADSFEAINSAIVKGYDYLDFVTKGDITPPRLNGGMVYNAWWVATNILKIYASPKGRIHFENVLHRIGLSHNGVVQEIIRSFSSKDDFQYKMERFSLVSQEIDKGRSAKEEHIIKTLITAFDGKVSDDESRLLSSTIMEIDLQSLPTSGVNGFRLEELFSDEKYLKDSMDKITKELSLKASGNFYISQAKGLGNYMVDHKASIAQLLNAENIVKELNSGNPKNTANAKTVKLVDRLATLQAINRLDAETKAGFVKLYSKDEGALTRTVLSMHKSFVESSRNTSFKKSSVNYIKGYTSEIFDRGIDVKYGTLADKAAMRRDGYEYVRETSNRVTGKDNHLYINKHARLSEYNKQAIRTTDSTRKGTTVLDILTQTNPDKSWKEVKNMTKAKEARLKLEMADAVKAMYASSASPKASEASVVPTFDANGAISTFRVVMSKEEKISIMGRDNKVEYTLGRMYSTQIDKITTSTYNKKVFNDLVKDASSNFNLEELQEAEGDVSGMVSESQRDYTVIGVGGNDESMEKWMLIPEDSRNFIIERMEEEARAQGNYYFKFVGLPIRSDIFREIMGERSKSVANLGVFNYGDQVIGTKGVSNAVHEMEMMWMDVVGIAKTNIVIKMPVVFVQNFISNVILSMQSGMTLPEVYGLQKEGSIALKDYLKLDKELIAATVKMDSMSTTAAKAKAKLEVDRIKRAMDMNSAKPLIDAGFHSQVVEDARPADKKTSSKLTENIKSFRDKIDVPGVNTAINYMWLTEDTGLYQSLLSIIQSQDFIARYAMYHSRVTKNRSDFSKEFGRVPNKKETEAIYTLNINNVMDTFINYNHLNSGNLSYLNKIGFLMFTKFAVGSQRVAKDIVQRRPLNAITGAVLQGVVGDYDDVLNHSLLSGYDFTNLMHNPVQVIEKAYQPWLLQSDDLIMDGLKSLLPK